MADQSTERVEIHVRPNGSLKVYGRCGYSTSTATRTT